MKLNFTSSVDELLSQITSQQKKEWERLNGVRFDERQLRREDPELVLASLLEVIK